MPIQQYPLTGIVKDIDASTAKSGVTCTVWNITKGTRLASSDEVTTQADGSFSLDLANLPGTTPYENGDRLQVVFYILSENKCVNIRYTVDTAGYPNGKNLGTVYLHVGQPHLVPTRIIGGWVANSSAGNLYVDIYDRADDNLVGRVEVLANATVTLPASLIGMEIDGGICLVAEETTTVSTYTTLITK